MLLFLRRLYLLTWVGVDDALSDGFPKNGRKLAPVAPLGVDGKPSAFEVAVCSLWALEMKDEALEPFSVDIPECQTLFPCVVLYLVNCGLYEKV